MVSYILVLSSICLHEDCGIWLIQINNWIPKQITMQAYKVVEK